MSKVLNRASWVDVAKAIGIVLVVYGHVARGLDASSIGLNSEAHVLIDSIIYSFHMPLFFFLSGLFFSKSFEKYKALGLTYKKIDTILYPYILWTLIQGVLNVSLSSYTNNDKVLEQVLTFWEPYAQFWFLYTLFLLFLLSCIYFSALSQRYTLPLFIASALLYATSKQVTYPLPFHFIAEHYVFFVFGIWASKCNFKNFAGHTYVLWGSLILTLVAQYDFHVNQNFVYSDKGSYSLFLALTSITFICSLSVFLAARSVKWLIVIGSSSMAIYLMHIIAGSGVRIILVKLFGITSIEIHLLLGLTAGIGLPLVAMKIFEKYNIRYVFSAPLSDLLKNANR